jgi:hypothetical protein
VFILLLPPVLPPERPLSPSGPRIELTPGLRVTATVLLPDLDGRSMLHFAGRDVASHIPLPFPAGTKLPLEVLEGGESPTVRVLGPAGTAPPQTPVSARTYGLAAAVLAARVGGDLDAATAALMPWLPVLVSSGVLSAPAAGSLHAALAPSVAAPAGGPAAGQGLPEAPALAGALADQLTHRGLWLERQLAEALRQGQTDLPASPGPDLRRQLATLARTLEQQEGGGDQAPVRTALAAVQQALLAEQARTAAHFAADGTMDVRLPLLLAGQQVTVRLRIGSDDAPASGEHAAPRGWAIRLDVQLTDVGRVQVVLGWTPHQIRAEFFTETAAAADRMDAALADLTAALTTAGYARVLARVTVDPVRLFTDDDLPDLPPEGTILSADA